MDKLDAICTKLGLNEFNNVPTLKMISQKTTGGLVTPAHMIAGLSVIVVLLTLLDIGKLQKK